MFIVTIAVAPGPRFTSATFPTSTPAIRTGVREWSSLPELTTALSWKLDSQGSDPPNAR